MVYSARSAIVAPLIGNKLAPMVVKIRYKDKKGKEKSLTMGGMQRAKEAVELMNECAQKHRQDK